MSESSSFFDLKFMNEILGQIETTIDSLELAKISGRRHDHLLSSIDIMNRDLKSTGKPVARVGTMPEIDIVYGFDRYFVTKDGNVYSTGFTSRTGNFINRILKLKPAIDKDGYKIVCLYKSRFDKKNFKVSRLIAYSFIPNPENKPEVNHIDGNKLNNNVDNLEWCTTSENQLHSVRVLGNKPVSYWNGKKNHNLRKKVFQFTQKMELIKIWGCQKDVFEKGDFSRAGLGKVLNGKWKHYKGFIFMKEETVKGYHKDVWEEAYGLTF